MKCQHCGHESDTEVKTFRVRIHSHLYENRQECVDVSACWRRQEKCEQEQAYRKAMFHVPETEVKA